MRRFGVEYIDRLLAGDEYDELVELSSIICGSPRFSWQAPDYGLPPVAFTFVETLCWFAQAIRSGAWTYYEATPQIRQEAMLRALQNYSPAGYAEWYGNGMELGEAAEKNSAVDKWIESTDSKAQRWLRQLAIANRGEILAVTA